MKSKRTLKEAVIKDFSEKYWEELERKALGNPFFQMVAKEAKLDGSDAGALGKVHEEIILGCEPYLTREVIGFYETDKPSLKFGKNAMATAGDMTAGAFPTTGETQTFQTVTCDQIKGVNPNWTREYLEDAAWAVVARQARGAGRAVEQTIMDRIIAKYRTGVEASGNVTSISDPITWAEFVDFIATMEAADAHPDVILTSPKIYGQLLALDQFVNSLYAGSDEVMRSGICKTTFGVKIIRSSRVASHELFGIEKDKAGALVMRRDLITEPYERPESNEYGFVTSTRFGVECLHACGLRLASAC